MDTLEKEMAEILGMKDVTFRSRVHRYKEKIEITYGGSENCEFCQRLKLIQENPDPLEVIKPK